MSMFTRRHYIWLANAMLDMKTETLENGAFAANDRDFAQAVLNDGIRNFAESLQDESPGFDKTQFFANIFGPAGAKITTCTRCGETIFEEKPGIWTNLIGDDSCADQYTTDLVQKDLHKPRI